MDGLRIAVICLRLIRWSTLTCCRCGLSLICAYPIPSPILLQSVAASPAAAGQTNQPRTKKQKTQQDAEDAIEAEPHTVDSDAEEDEDPAAVEVVADPSSDSESSDDDADASASNSDSNSDSDSDSDVPSKSVVSNLTTQTRQLQFRNYTPHDTSLRISKVSNIDLQKDNEWMDKELQEVIENALNNEDDVRQTHTHNT